MKGIIYYTTNLLDGTFLNEVVKAYIADSGLPITSSSQLPIDFGDNYVNDIIGRSQSIMFNQIITALKKSSAKYVFFCEHDVLYHPTYWDFTPPSDDKCYYNNNALRYRLEDRRIVGFDSAWLSQLCVNRELILDHYLRRVEYIKQGNKAYGFEPGAGQSRKIDDLESEMWESEYPNIDVRHGDNLTGNSRMFVNEFRSKSSCRDFKVHDVSNIPGWSADLLLSL